MNQVTPASLRYPLSVFNKNSTLKCQNCLLCTFNVTYMQCDVPSNVTCTFNLTCILCDVCLPFDTKRFYSRVPGDRNWPIETADWNLAGFFTIFRNLLAGIWGSFLRFIETGFRNWLAAFLGFSYDFSMMSMIFL